MNIKKKNIIIVSAIIAVIAISYFSYSNTDKVKSVDRYLADNYKTSDFTEEGMSSAFKLIDDSNKYDVFFTGECHGNLGNEEISLQMLKYLNKKEGVKYLICEMQYSIISKLNKYIQNGDEELLKDAVAIVKKHNPAYASNDYYKFWQGLYNYNKSLSKDKRIQAFGVDVDLIGDYTMNEMINCIPDTEPPTEMSRNVNDFKNIFSGIVSDEEAITILMNLNEDLNSNTQAYKAFLGDNFYDFKNNLNSMMNTIKYAETEDANRDSLIYNNFTRIYNENPEGKYYGQFGAAHIFREDINLYSKDFYTFAKMLEKNGDLKVLSLPIVYNDQMMVIEDVEKLATNDFTIFKLNGRHSPYKEGLENFFTSSSFEIINGSTVDNYQYVILYSKK